MFATVAPEANADRWPPRYDSERREINDFLADTGVWISGGVIFGLVLWLVLTELWR